MDSKIKGGGGLAEFPLWPLDLRGGDLRGLRSVDSNWIARDFEAAKWGRIALGNLFETGCRIHISLVER